MKARPFQMFTDVQKLSIVKILGITPTVLDAQIAVLGAALTTAKETAVLAELTRWEIAGIEFAKLHPKESNRGVETFPEMAKNDIRKNIALILEMYEFSYSGNMGTIQIGL